MLPGLPMSGTLDIWQCQSAVLCAHEVQNLPNVQHFGRLGVPKCCTVCAWGPESAECTALWTPGSAKVLYCVRAGSRICRMYSTLDVLSTTRIPPYYRPLHFLDLHRNQLCDGLDAGIRIRAPPRGGLQKLIVGSFHRSTCAPDAGMPRDANSASGPTFPHAAGQR